MLGNSVGEGVTAEWSKDSRFEGLVSNRVGKRPMGSG